jgi:hypothetical protein
MGFRLQWSISDQDNEGSWLTLLVLEEGRDRKERVRPLAI